MVGFRNLLAPGFSGPSDGLDRALLLHLQPDKRNPAIGFFAVTEGEFPSHRKQARAVKDRFTKPGSDPDKDELGWKILAEPVMPQTDRHRQAAHHHPTRNHMLHPRRLHSPAPDFRHWFRAGQEQELQSSKTKYPTKRTILPSNPLN